MIEILRFICVLIAAAVIGNWFLAELRKTRAQGKPLHKAYMSIPGLLIVGAAIVLPVIIWMVKK